MNLTEYCRELAGATVDAGAWVSRNTELVRNEQNGLLKELRRAGRVFRRCARAAERKMCGGVFGPSQAGKSYLISVLARDAKGDLMALFGEKTHNFITEINPGGGRESTGLVTRFTMTRPASLPQGFPVQLRLLSETDIVKIIANSYFADCEHKDDPESDIDVTLKRLEARVGQGDPHIDLDAMEDLREYLKEFCSMARAKELENSYWGRAQDLGPRLGLDDRIQLYALIWDEVTELTELLRLLLKALEALGWVEDVFCSLDALIPREISIIDVATLNGLDAIDQDKQLTVVTATNSRGVELPRAVVTALTAELTIVMETSPITNEEEDYFKYTDLLDFPGYRSREKITHLREELQNDQNRTGLQAGNGVRRNMFLRGKVAYLFQRYCAERELTAMLLCIGNGPQEVNDLPGVISQWIDDTHGKNPASRKDKQVSLFFVLTKCDMEFNDAAGADIAQGWNTRLYASLQSYFGRQGNWVDNWDDTSSFKNLFLLRNPNFRFTTIMDMDGFKELRIQHDREDYVNTLRQSFLDSPLVQKHFHDPKVSWDALMSLNDGGIGLIRERLMPVCNPEIKRIQILQTLQDLRGSLCNRLKAFYKTDDKKAAREQKRNQVFCVDNLLRRQARPQLGRLLHAFTIEDADISAMYDEAVRHFRLQSNEQPEETRVAPENWNPLFEDSTEIEAAPVKDEAAFFAAYVESSWVGNLHALAEDTSSQAYFRLPEQDFSVLVSELATGAARLHLQHTMAQAFRKAARYANTGRECIVRQQAGIASRIINNYVAWLGLNPHADEAARTISDSDSGKSTVLFTPPQPVKNYPQLSEKHGDYVNSWFLDWRRAFYALAMDNVNFDGNQTINIKENDCLGDIIKRIGTNPPEPAKA